MFVSIRRRKLPVTTLLRASGLIAGQEISGYVLRCRQHVCSTLSQVIFKLELISLDRLQGELKLLSTYRRSYWVKMSSVEMSSLVDVFQRRHIRQDGKRQALKTLDTSS